MGNNQSVDSLRATLTQVRKAYRLLAAYTQSVLDIAQQIAETAGDPEFLLVTTDMERRQSTNERLMNSARNFVPVYQEFNYIISTKEHSSTYPRTWFLMIWHRGDSGFESLDFKDAPLPSRFESSPDQCSTDLYLAAYIPSDDSDLPTQDERSFWQAIYDNAPYPDTLDPPGDDDPRRFHGGFESVPAIRGASHITLGIWGRYYQISDFANEKALKETVKEFLIKIAETQNPV